MKRGQEHSPVRLSQWPTRLGGGIDLLMADPGVSAELLAYHKSIDQER